MVKTAELLKVEMGATHLLAMKTQEQRLGYWKVEILVVLSRDLDYFKTA